MGVGTDTDALQDLAEELAARTSCLYIAWVAEPDPKAREAISRRGEALTELRQALPDVHASTDQIVSTTHQLLEALRQTPHVAEFALAAIIDAELELEPHLNRETLPHAQDVDVTHIDPHLIIRTASTLAAAANIEAAADIEVYLRVAATEWPRS